MQAFGRSPALQAHKIKETTERSQQLGGLVATMLRPSPKDRISASGLVQHLATGEVELTRATALWEENADDIAVVKVERTQEVAELKAAHTQEVAELKAARKQAVAELSAKLAASEAAHRALAAAHTAQIAELTN